mmetsp:Transcript_17764/g.50008  ORF Transcript_17764/g.50008 Transcript_17764/m.50008 type:complete len:267 (+) Transcript_17764:859-1659(+)
MRGHHLAPGHREDTGVLVESSALLGRVDDGELRLAGHEGLDGALELPDQIMGAIFIKIVDNEAEHGALRSAELADKVELRLAPGGVQVVLHNFTPVNYNREVIGLLGPRLGAGVFPSDQQIGVGLPAARVLVVQFRSSELDLQGPGKRFRCSLAGFDLGEGHLARHLARLLASPGQLPPLLLHHLVERGLERPDQIVRAVSVPVIHGPQKLCIHTACLGRADLELAPVRRQGLLDHLRLRHLHLGFAHRGYGNKRVRFTKHSVHFR